MPTEQNSLEDLRLTVEVAGSSGEVHVIHATRNGEQLVMTCSCEAGKKHMACRHRLALLAGDGNSAVGGNTDAAALISVWLAGSNIEAALRDLTEAECEAEAAKRKVSAMKKRLGRMLDGR